MADEQIIREVEHGSPEYWATVDLRNLILRKPLGLVWSAEDLEEERHCRHLACFYGDKLVGCLFLQPLADGDVKMRQLAVVSELQGQGIGTALVQQSEVVALGLGFRRMILHARETAVGFYEKLGYSRLGEAFEEVTIPHWAMEKCLRP